MENKKSVLIEMSIEACLLTEDQVVANALGSYEGLPWLADSGSTPHIGVPAKFDIHFENAFLGEEVLAPPFQNANSILRKGVHLHWIVPGFFGLEQEIPGNNNEKKMPAAPNRWRIQKNGDPTKEWLLASDYVHFPSSRLTHSEKGQMHFEIDWEDDFSVFPDPNAPPYQPPFFYLGRCFAITAAPDEEELYSKSFSKRFGRPLAVTGFGSLQFSASYTNCRSVFGFHDASGGAGDSYTITGWHARTEDDLVLRIIKERSNEENFSLSGLLKEKFDVDMAEENTGIDSSAEADPAISYEQTLYVSHVIIDVAPPEADTGRLKIAVGHTATEAISALTAHNLSEKKAADALPEEQWRTKMKNEDLLEYMLMNPEMSGYLVDQVPRFLEARHKQGFLQHQGGLLYEFVAQETEGVLLNEDTREELNKLNEIRHRLNETENELHSLENQLYADWYKYMRAAYPPLGASDTFADRDHLRHLVETSGLNTIDIKKQENTELQIELQEKLLFLTGKYLSDLRRYEGMLEAVVQSESKEDTSYKGALEKLKSQRETLESHEIQRTKHLENIKSKKDPSLISELMALLAGNFQLPPFLKEVPEAPFYEPREPVLAIDGFDLKQRSGTTRVRVADNVRDNNNRPLCPGKALINETRLSALVWCPLFMEWQAGLLEVPLDTHQDERWQEAFLDHFLLDDDSPGIYRKPHAPAQMLEGSYFQGGGFLNPHLTPVFSDRINKYADFCENQEALADAPAEKNQWKENRRFAKEVAEGVKNAGIMCQSLAGFNAACLQLRQVPQLHLKEPLGFESSKEFTARVARACEYSAQLSPATLYDFLPIRNGSLIIERLRFLDNFGRITDFKEFENLITADTLSAIDLRKSTEDLKKDDAEFTRSLRKTFLPPRLVQPSRLNTHILTEGRRKIASKPSVSPVCGWIIPNSLNNSLMLFDTGGAALGALGKQGKWEPLPWEESVLEERITNNHFRKVINRILSNSHAAEGSEPYIDPLSDVLQNVLKGIAPADFSLPDTKILLAGRPLAVVQIHIDLQIRGYPALDQSWKATLLDARKALEKKDEESFQPHDRYSGSWNRISLPLRIGEYGQLNDGLAGYWVEKDGELLPTFYTPVINNSSIIRGTLEQKPAMHTIQADDNRGITITALIDPLGTLNFTTGLLPTQTVSLPPTLVAPALAKMQLWFKTGPILHFQRPASTEGEPLPESRFFDLPDLPGHRWAWFEQEVEAEIVKPVFTEIHHQLPVIISGHLVLK